MQVARASLMRLQALRGYKGFLLAVILGALGVLGHAPFHIWPAFAVSICGLFLLLDGASPALAGPVLQRAGTGKTKVGHPSITGFRVAWSWAFGYFLGGMFWVGNAFLVDAEKFAALMPFAVTALPALLALVWGIGGAIALTFWRPHASRLLLFVFVFSSVEFARGHILTGLPWNLPAYIWRAGNVFSQTSALIGPYGLSGLTLFVLACPVVLVTAKTKLERYVIAGTSMAILVAVSAFGLARLHQAGPLDAMKGSGPIIAAGQAGFSQKEVWDPANTNRVTQTYLESLASPEAQKADIVVWPEGAFPFLLLEQPDVLQAIEAKLGGRTLVLGSIRRNITPAGDIYSNSILALEITNGGLTLRAAYDKFHLVPFGEYLPFRPVFKALGIASLVSYEGEMTPGSGPGLLEVKNAPLADPRVCYEIVFPGFNKMAQGKAGWILNVSVDAWYGDLLGPDQHYAQARMRAIETGRPLVRAASGGWSSVTDRYGRALAEHRSGAGFAVARLPLDAVTTIYDQFGELVFSVFLLVMLVFLVIWRQTKGDFIVELDTEPRQQKDIPYVK